VTSSSSKINEVVEQHTDKNHSNPLEDPILQIIDSQIIGNIKTENTQEENKVGTPILKTIHPLR